MKYQNFKKQFVLNTAEQDKFTHYGRIHKANNYLIEAKGLTAQIGSLCLLELDGHPSAYAEVVGFTGDVTYLMAYNPLSGLSPNTQITQLNQTLKKPYGDGLLGRVLDAYGAPLDCKGDLINVEMCPEYKRAFSPILKRRIDKPLDIGVKVINSLLTIGQGQRVGLMAGSGVGKSVLLGMIAKNADVDIIVVGLIGERSREVKEFIDDNLAQKISNMVMVVASADTSPLSRIPAMQNFLKQNVGEKSHFQNDVQELYKIMGSKV